MARKSRNMQLLPSVLPKQPKIYNTALYARLSIEDNGIQASSIENQIHLIEEYIRNNNDLHLVNKWIDNGETGTNFERPGFIAMMEAVKNGKINCIVVKDLSRFGRNYLETGEYLESVFPILNIRFVSIGDNYDSHKNGNKGFCIAENNDSLLVSLKAILHDNYAKDISKKVSTAIDVKKKSGKFLNKIPPFGYVRSSDNRYQLVVHPERAEIIKSIFQWKSSGLGPVVIARKLNNLGVPSQMKIRFLEGCSDGKETALWHGSSILDILKNPCYLGHIVERKSRHVLGNKNNTINPCDWNLLKNMHEGIIDSTTFDLVQLNLSNSSKKNNSKSSKDKDRKTPNNILCGLLICPICGSKLQRNSGYYNKENKLLQYQFNCPRKYMKKEGCSLKSIDETKILQLVFKVLNQQLRLLTDHDVNHMNGSFANTKQQQCSNLAIKIKKALQNMNQIKTKKIQLYEDYKNNFVSIESYQCAKKEYNITLNQLEEEVNHLKITLCHLENESNSNNQRSRNQVKLNHPLDLTNEICSALVKYIVINDDTF